MPLLPNLLSSRSQIQIKEVRDNILVLPKNTYCVLLETSSVNFELKSDEEQDALLENFQNFLNSLPSRLQILVRIRELDIDMYLDELKLSEQNEKEQVFKKQIQNYREFIKSLVSGNKILSRRFYIIIPYSPTDNSDFSLIKEQLQVTQDIVIKGIEKMGMRARPLENLEILQMFYSFYSEVQNKIQPLSAEAIGKITNYGSTNI